MSSEKAAVKTLRKHMLARWPGAHWQRLEDALSVGVPDITVMIPGLGELWIEAKEVDALPKRPATPIRCGLKKEQKIWLEAAQKAGREVCVMVRGPWGWAWFDNRFSDLEKGLPWSQFRAAACMITDKCDPDAIRHFSRCRSND
jgi:hypothetical protein